MKKRHFIFATAYLGAMLLILSLSSCVEEPLNPNEPVGNGVDTTWVDPNDSLADPNGGSNPYDSTYNGGCGNGGTDPNDSTWTDPNGGGNPTDTLGGGN